MDVKVRRKGVVFILFLALVLIGMVLAASTPSAPLGAAHVRNPEEAQAFLKSLGWECISEQCEMKASTLPTEFDDTFIAYNAIQLKQGCDLSKYAGKAITVYNLPVTNHESTDHVWATLIVYRSTVIGGDIHSAAMDGFMEPLLR